MKLRGSKPLSLYYKKVVAGNSSWRISTIDKLLLIEKANWVAIFCDKKGKFGWYDVRWAL